MDLAFAREQFSVALLGMAQSSATLPERVREAFAAELIHLRPEEHLPPDLRPTFEELSLCLTDREAAGEEGAAGATASPMTAEDAEEATGMIVDLHDEIVSRCNHATAGAGAARRRRAGSRSRLELGLPRMGQALASDPRQGGVSPTAGDGRPPVTFDETMGAAGGEKAELRGLAASFIKLLAVESSTEEALTRLAEIANSLATTPAATLAELRYKLTATQAHLIEQFGEADLATELLTSALDDLDQLIEGPGGLSLGAAL